MFTSQQSIPSKIIFLFYFYVIILKCIIIAFFFGGFLPFFQGKIVVFDKKGQRNLRILPKKTKIASAITTQKIFRNGVILFMMLKPRKLGTTVRQSFSKIEAATEMPNLIEVQKDSYEWFLREGLNEVLRDVSPIVDYTGNLSIEFTDYSIDPTPRYPVEECKDRSVTYDAHMKVGVRLVNKATGELKTAQIFLGDFPLMTDSGTFVINGAERAIVSQLVRSPGVYYSFDKDKTGKDLFKSTVIPNRGAWLEYEMDSNDVVYVRNSQNSSIIDAVIFGKSSLKSWNSACEGYLQKIWDAGIWQGGFDAGNIVCADYVTATAASRSYSRINVEQIQADYDKGLYLSGEPFPNSRDTWIVTNKVTPGGANSKSVYTK